LNCDLPLLLAPTYCELLSDHSQFITTLGHGDCKSVFWHTASGLLHSFPRIIADENGIVSTPYLLSRLLLPQKSY
jgi:hypothetical protein